MPMPDAPTPVPTVRVRCPNEGRASDRPAMALCEICGGDNYTGHYDVPAAPRPAEQGDGDA